MIELLKNIQLFENLSGSELEKILPLCVKQTFPAGTTIFRDGEPGDICYIVLSGAVRVSKFIPNVGEEALAVLREGEYFGEMALVDDFPRSANAVTNDATDVFAVNRADLEDLLARDRELACKLFRTFTKTLSKRLRETNEKLAAFLAMSGGF